MTTDTEYALGPLTPTATVGANGTATAPAVGPTAYGEEWVVERYNHSVSVGTATCSVYRNTIADSSRIDYSEDTESDTSENNSIRLQLGEKLIVQWTNATVGAIATINISGIRRVKGRRAY